MEIGITIEGQVQFHREIEAIAANAKGIDHVLHQIAADMRRTIRRNFETEGDYAAGGWAPLSEAYLKQKQAWVASGKIMKNGLPAKHTQILRLTDRMRRSLIYKSDIDHIELVHNHQLEFGTRVEYARYHQLPSLTHKNRRYLVLDEHRRRKYARAMLTYIRTGKSGLEGGGLL